MGKITNIEGIGEENKKKLANAGIKTTEDLLNKGATAKGRKNIEDLTGVGHKSILKWTNMADLFRIKGLGEEYTELLEAAGVDTVKELALRKPENLHNKILEVNETKKLVRRPPSLEMVSKWVEEAKGLPRVVKY
jgi:predicted flap endonuclease-1-like 5' DNA nuclease